MTYNTNVMLRESDKKIFEDLLSLEPGAFIELSFQTQEGASAKRHTIYAWLKNNNLKQFYRVYWPETTRLQVKRLDVVVQTCTVKTTQLSEKLETIFQNLIMFETVEDANKFLNDKRLDGTITPEEFGILLHKYEEFMK